MVEMLDGSHGPHQCQPSNGDTPALASFQGALIQQCVGKNIAVAPPVFTAQCHELVEKQLAEAGRN